MNLPTVNGFQIAFPILDNPATAVFNMLLGKDSDLFFLKADAVVDLEPPVGLSYAHQGPQYRFEYTGHAHIDTHFRFAYDTFGLRQLIRNLCGRRRFAHPQRYHGRFLHQRRLVLQIGRILSSRDGISEGPPSVGEVSTQNHGADPIHIYIEDPNGDGSCGSANSERIKTVTKKGFWRPAS